MPNGFWFSPLPTAYQKKPYLCIAISQSGSPTQIGAPICGGESEQPRVLFAKTEFWRVYEGIERDR